MPTAHNSTPPIHPNPRGQSNSSSSTALCEEGRLQKLAANVPGVLFEYVQRPDGSDDLSYISPGCREIYELEPQAVLENMTLMWALVHPDEIDTLRSTLIASAQTLQPWKMEWRIYTSSGKLKWLSGTSRPELQPNGDTVFYGYIQDITERKQTEERAQRQLTVIEAATVGIAILNEKSEFTYINKAHFSIYGYSHAEELLGKSWRELYYPEEINRLESEVFPTLERQGQWKGEAIGKKRDGRTFTQEISLTVSNDEQLICICADITERKLAEVALRESQRRYQTLIETSPICIFQTDPRGNCTYINDRWSEITGLSVEKALGQGWIYALHPDDRERVFTEWYGAIIGQRQFTTEYRLVGADGKIIWVTIQVMAEVGEDGQGVGYIGAIADISDRFLAEREQQKFITLIDRSSEFIGISDLEGNPLYLNEAGQKMVGLSGMEEVKQIDLLDCCWPEDRPYLSEVLLPKVMAEGRAESDLRFGHFKTGEAIYVYWTLFTLSDPETGQPFALATITRDITERKRAEEALRQTTRQLEEAQRLARIGNWELDVATQTVTWSEELFRIFEVEVPETPTFEKLIELIYPPDREMLQRAIDKAIANGTPYKIDLRINRPTGEMRYMVAWGEAERNDTRQVQRLFGAAMDITDRKEAEIALQEREEFLRSIYDGTEQAIFVLDVTPEGDFRYVGWNPACERVTNMSTGEVFGKTPVEMFGPTQGLTLFQNYMNCLETESTINYEECIDFRGSDSWFLTTLTPLSDRDAKIYRIVGTTVDITDRKRAELALSKSEEQLRELARQEQLINRLASQIRDSLDLDTILETTVRQLRDLLEIDLCVFAWYRPEPAPPVWEVYKEEKTAETPSILGTYTTDEIGSLARRILRGKIVRYDDVAAISLEELRDSLLERGYKSILGLPIQTISGDLGTVICINRSRVRHWSDGEVELLASIREQLAIAINQAELYERSLESTRIATAKSQELKASLSQLQRTQSQLIQAEKMSSLGQLVAGVAHEINNPVSFIYGNISPAKEYIRDLLRLIEMYEQHYPEPAEEIAEEIDNIELEFLADDLPKLLQSIQVGAERIKEIVKSLRTFSRLDEAEVKEVDIHENIDSTLMILQTKLKHGPNHSEIQIVTDYGDLPSIECYVGQLNQVFMNIISNAIDALHERDKNRSFDDIKAEPSFVKIESTVDKEWVEIKISDNGTGIKPEGIEKIFDPFYTTKAIGKGTGLGLSISYQIVVDKHGGDLRCVSEWGRGTKFIIKLPVTINN
ncbi:MAG: PAS domain S-box protein [Cyanobacteriota bacterium]|nr:PAS domain S-box protein [Cyanobacteriota bacterium]